MEWVQKMSREICMWCNNVMGNSNNENPKGYFVHKKCENMINLLVRAEEQGIIHNNGRD